MSLANIRSLLWGRTEAKYLQKERTKKKKRTNPWVKNPLEKTQDEEPCIETYRRQLYKTILSRREEVRLGSSIPRRSSHMMRI